MQILHAYSNDEPELTVALLSERLGMHKSVVSRLVTSLCAWRMLERDTRTKRIRLGMGVLELGMQVAQQKPLYRLALPILGNLVERVRHSAHVTVLDGAEMLVIASVESPDALRVTLRQGDRRPLHATGAGKAVLASMAPERSKALLEQHGMTRLTHDTITSAKALHASLEAVRQTGVAWNEGESAVGVGGVAAPVFDASGANVGALSLVFPQHTVPDTQRPVLAIEVRRAAAALSQALGHRSPIPITRTTRRS